jgi:PST family polysaccharide transporter
VRRLRALWRSGEGDASLAGQMGKAAAWSSLGSIAVRLGSFSVGIVAARLIAPDQFGVFAVALTVHAIIVNVSDLGVSAYIVRHNGDLAAVGPTVTTIAMASAALLALAMALAAPWISAELGSAAATGPVRVLSLTVLLAGVSSVPGAVLTREFQQDKRFLASLANFLVSTAILLALALSGGGALALAWSRVAGQVASVLVLIKTSPVRFWPGFDRSVVASVATFGLPLVGSSFLGFLIGNVDYIVIGRLLGAEPLGFYYLAYNAGSWPYVIMAPIVASVAVAAFSRVRSDRARFAERMRTSMAALLVVALPASALIIALAQPLVEAIYGSRWASAAAALAFTAAYGAMRVPADLLSNVAIAEGRTRAMLVCQIAYLLALAPLTVVGVEAWGIVGAGAAHVLAIALVLLPGFMLMLAPSTGFGMRDLVASGARPLLAATAAGLVAYLLAQQVDGAWGALLVGGLGGAAVYVALIAAWGRRVVVAGRRLWSVGRGSDPGEEGIEFVPAHRGASA